MNIKLPGLILLAAFSIILPASACINETGTNSRGERIELLHYAGQNLKPRLSKPPNKDFLIEGSKAVVKNAQKNPSFNNLNALAAVLIRHGRLPAAVKLLQFLERKYPGQYQTAANLGTAYELMGRNEDALKWIKEGIKRNELDHYGTEWLHVHILKAKLGQVPKAAPGQSILSLDYGNEVMPRRPSGLPVGSDGKPLSLFALGEALRYQLLERIEFVAAPDAMVAGLLLDWANLELVAGSVESAGVLYDAALRYGSAEGKIIGLRKMHVAKILAQPKAKPASGQAECELCEPPREVVDTK